MKSIKWKLVFIYFALVFMVMIISSTFIIISQKNQEETKLRNQLVGYARFIKDQVILPNSSSKFQYVLLEGMRNTTYQNFEGAILDSRGVTIASSASISGKMPVYSNKSIIAALSGETAFSGEKWENDPTGFLKEWIYYSEPVPVDNTITYVIFTRTDAKNVRESITDTTQTLLITMGMAMCFTVVIGYIFASTLTEPIITLTKKAKEIAEGNLNIQISAKSDDEIGQLTDSFNYMTRTLNVNVSKIEDEKNKLEIVMDNMTDGILAFDDKGVLVHYNPKAAEMLDLTFTDSYTILEFIKQFDITSSVILDSGGKSSKEINFTVLERVIKATFTSYTNEGDIVSGNVVVLQDITEEKRLDDMRKEFVANVSHELRTPLTTIKSYTETMIDGGLNEEKSKEFLAIIENEADRMALLVTDLLQLSKLDNQQLKLTYKEIQLKPFLERIIGSVKIHAKEKQQTLILEPIPESVFITADPDRINQVINNIVMNSIKYSGEGTAIEIGLKRSGDFLILFVKDNGFGIPKDDVERIFERFYRVDKARSRQMGGTGLGLAIAKEIMEVHGGKITVESKFSSGTTMYLWFPIGQKG